MHAASLDMDLYVLVCLVLVLCSSLSCDCQPHPLRGLPIHSCPSGHHILFSVDLGRKSKLIALGIVHRPLGDEMDEEAWLIITKPSGSSMAPFAVSSFLSSCYFSCSVCLLFFRLTSSSAMFCPCLPSLIRQFFLASP